MKNKNRAFTLAEIILVLMIIGFLTAILLPNFTSSNPKKVILKFKKGNETLGTAISKLSSTDGYFLPGDFGFYANGSIASSANFFCESLANIMNVKSKNCSSTSSTGSNQLSVTGYTTNTTVDNQLDTQCKDNKPTKAEIITADGISYYIIKPQYTFANVTPSNMASSHYKYFCMDIDDIGASASNDCTNIAPFGYGIRRDGKIILGTRAKKWLELDEFTATDNDVCK